MKPTVSVDGDSKACRRCKEVRPLTDYYVDRSTGKHRASCRFCYAASQRERVKDAPKGRIAPADLLLSAVDDDLRTWKNYEYMSGYVQVLTTPTVHLHRVIAERILGRKLKRGEVVDHIDGVKWNNRRENLRVVTRSQNQHNIRGPYKTKKTGLPRGVQLTPAGRYWVCTTQVVDGKIRPRYLGTYDTVEEASAAYEAYRRKKAGLDKAA